MFGKRGLGKRGQVTLFVILAIVIVIAGLVIYFARNNMTTTSIPDSIDPLYTKFLQCLEDDVVTGISILESNAGYIELPEFNPGSRYQPFSSQLTFAGVEIPYWSYMGGSNIMKYQMPKVGFMEDELADFIDRKISYCSFREFEDAGFSIDLGDPMASIKISDDFIDVDLKMDISLSKGVDSAYISSHDLRVKSKLGFLYSEAVKVYEKEQSDFFLEDLTIDVLRLYAPVDGVELSCSPKTWSADDVYTDVKEALEANTIMFTNKGKSNDYFTLDLNDDADIDFVYSSDWPTYMEVNPTEGNMMVATPVGNQQGLGMLGFCYVPYHFVYNFRHPVLVQVSDSGETFQFPMVVLVEGNVPRTSRATESGAPAIEGICEDANTRMEINVYDYDLNPVEANVRFECFGSSCDMGKTENGELSTLFPQCINGIVTVEVDGYKKSSNIFSTVNSGSLVILLDREYELDVDLRVSGKKYSGNAMVVFSSDDYLQTVVYPDVKKIKLPSGLYDVRVQMFANSEIVLPASSQEHCVEVPRSGVLGVAGLTQKQCSIVQVEEQIVTSAITGGGITDVFFDNYQLKNSNSVVIEVNNLNIPKTFEELQENYVAIEVNEVGVTLR